MDIGAHRDNHYIFFVLTEGSGAVTVDFEEKTVGPNQLGLPGPHYLAL